MTNREMLHHPGASLHEREADKANFIAKRHTCITMQVTAHADNATIYPAETAQAWAKLYTQTVSQQGTCNLMSSLHAPPSDNSVVNELEFLVLTLKLQWEPIRL